MPDCKECSRALKGASSGGSTPTMEGNSRADIRADIVLPHLVVSGHVTATGFCRSLFTT